MQALICRFVAVMCLAWGSLCLAPAAALAAVPAKFALVIGNSRYGGAHDLANAGNDARLMATTLASMGFAVTEHYNLGRSQLNDAVAGFAARLPAGATSFVYYAGHGMQLDGSSYLTPVDMPVTSPTAAKLHSYALQTLLQTVAKAKSSVNIVVLDACRNNPFQPRSAVRYRSFAGLGLSPVAAPRGTFIAYSTAPGQLAPDGKGGNSLYTATLAKTLIRPATELENIFRQVSNEVRRLTRDDQIPWYESSLAGVYYFDAQDRSRLASRQGQADVRGAVDVRSQQARGGIPAKSESTLWFRQMSAAELSQLDWEIQQRVRRLTPDEIPALQHHATGGSVVAQTVLGLTYREGIEPVRLAGTQQVARYKPNNGLAWKWLKKAAEAGFPMAQVEIGEMYYQAHGTARDTAKSLHWIERAAETNYPRAKLDLVQLQAAATPGKINVEDAARSMFESLRPAARPAGSLSREHWRPATMKQQ